MAILEWFLGSVDAVTNRLHKCVKLQHLLPALFSDVLGIAVFHLHLLAN